MTEPQTERIRIVLADDHPMLISGVSNLIAEASDMKVVGTASTGSAAVRLIVDAKPDIAVLDIAMPDLNGIAVARQLALAGCKTPVIILSGHESRIYVTQSLSAGARGYLLKRTTGENLLHAIRSVHGGGLYLDPAIADRHFPSGGNGRAVRTTAVKTGTVQLTERETEVLRLVALGFTNKEIAAELGVTSKSVETYKARASDKLGLRSRAKIVQYAILRGWLNDIAS